MYNLAGSYLFFFKVHRISGPIQVFVSFISFFLYFLIFWGGKCELILLKRSVLGLGLGLGLGV